MATGIFNNGDYSIEDDSNGDLVVKDPNDNVVLKWDTSIPGWTFNNNSIEGLSSVSTEQLFFNNISSDTATNVITADETDGDNRFEKNIQYQFGVGTSATTIYSPSGSGFFVGHRVTVLIRFATSQYALDEVLMLSDGNASATSSIERNSPPSRTYTNANSAELQLELASDTANVVAFGSSLDINRP